MATKIYDCIVATSKYQDSNGQEKRKWENVGAVFQDTDNNGNSYSYIMLKKTFNPAGIESREGADSIRITLSKPKQQGQQQQQQTQQQNAYNNNQNSQSFGSPIESNPFENNTHFQNDEQEIPF